MSGRSPELVRSTFAAIDALADGYEASFVEDAIGDGYKEYHDLAVVRLVHAGALARTTSSMIAQWFRDWQLEKTTLAGVGLGLAIAKAIVEAHGGGIRVESAPGRGSPFRFTLLSRLRARSR